MDRDRLCLPDPSWRAQYLEDVRRRLANGELDSDDAVLETAYALLDGDPAQED
ncbi:MAG: hypothetical protein AAGD14_08310 [Planctomycetota bacterium]